MKFAKKIHQCSLAILLLLGAGTVQAASLLELSAFTTDAGPLLSDTVGASSLPNLINSLINTKDQFSAYQNRQFQASLTYGGVANAIRFSVNSSGTQAFLRIPSTGFQRLFTGPDRSYVDSSIQDFLKKEGSAEFAKFLKEMNKTSTVSVVDGNPNSSTAMMSAQTYAEYSSSIGETREERDSPKDSTGSFGFGFVADAGKFNTKGFSGDVYSLPLYARFKVSDRVGLNFNIPITYIRIQSAQIFNLGLGVGIPIKVVKPTADFPMTWQVTPSGGAIASGSKDLVAGGLLTQGAISSMLSYDFKNFSISMGNHFGLMQSVPVTIGSYRFDPNLSQEVLKNGLKLTIPFGRRWVAEAYGIYTHFLEQAAIGNYYTVGGEIGYRFLGKTDSGKKKRGYVKAGIYSDLAPGFSSAHIQAGTGWKF